MSDSSPDAIFLSWIGFHGRSAGIADALGVESHFVSGGRGPAPLRYLRAWRETRRLLRQQRVGTVIVMLPPAVALACVAWVAPRSTRIVGDLHTGVFTDPKWRWALGWQMRVLRRRGFAIVTGEALAAMSRSMGVKAIQLHDTIDEPTDVSGAPDDPALAEVLDRRYVLVPLAYAFDEPIDALLDAAGQTPDVTWVLTGRAPDTVVHAAPKNVVFTGFVSRDDYSRLVKNASVLAALTTQENTMQRVGYEALSESKALITSGTAVLREFFGTSALYVTADASSIRTEALRALNNQERLEGDMRRRRKELQNEQEHRLNDLVAALKV